VGRLAAGTIADSSVLVDEPEGDTVAEPTARTTATPEHPGAPDLAAHIARLDREGFTIIEDAFDADLADELHATVLRLERDLDVGPSTNGFEGRATTRVYNLLAHDDVFRRLPVHPVVLPLVQHLLGPGCLVSSVSSITIGPGEVAQPIHADDQVMPLPKPHPATVANSMWAVTDFTEVNGATRIIPGTHLADSSPTYGQHYDSASAEMRRGSILVWHGSLWHGGGANRTDTARMGIAMNYCGGWVRQQENQQLGIPLDTVRTFSPELQELCGFGVYRGLIGHIDKRSPAEAVLGSAIDPRMVWERT
jgi:ectoine hydroxylase-related dioxygenase (phytanoyl-CoA dioxygenase family)